MIKTFAVAIFAALMLRPADNQAPADSAAFEVASVKRSSGISPGTGRIRSTGFRETSDPGQVTYTGATLRLLVMRAFDLKEHQINGPAWLDTERYDLVAKVPKGAPKEQVPEMLQRLLADRFKLVVHWESKQQRVYGLTVSSGGHHLKASGAESQGRASVAFTAGRVQMNGMTLGRFAEVLTTFLGYPVVDMTGIQGEFDIVLNVSMDELNGLRTSPLDPSLEVRDV